MHCTTKRHPWEKGKSAALSKAGAEKSPRTGAFEQDYNIRSKTGRGGAQAGGDESVGKIRRPRANGMQGKPPPVHLALRSRRRRRLTKFEAGDYNKAVDKKASNSYCKSL